ncbi:divalent-cation tolerance protein CutA [bacterium]|nr:divalent-cation tolerance protein CutA [bacterium]
MVEADEQYAVILVTTGSETQAERIARVLVEEKLAACCNIVPGIRSIYRWKDAVEEDDEQLLVIKTKRARFAEIEQRVRTMHEYDVPEIIMLPVTEGSAPYLAWIDQSLNGHA